MTRGTAMPIRVKKAKMPQKKVRRIEITCIFRGVGRSREFTTPGNFEAFNLLMRKLDKAGIKDRVGKLVFEFNPGDPSAHEQELRSLGL